MILEPKKIASLSDDELQAILKRSMEDISSIYEYVRTLVEGVRQKGDQALLDANREFKQDITVTDLRVSKQEFDEAYEKVEKKVIESLKIARNNIETFHRAQMERDMWSTEVAEGIIAGRITRPIEKIGCYIPGGLAAYPSTTLMTIIPAKVAGAVPLVQGGGDRSLYRFGLLVEVEAVAQQHGGAQDRGQRVGQPRAGDIGSRAVNRLVEPELALSERRRGQHAE